MLKDKQLLLFGTEAREQLYYRAKIFEITIGIVVISISVNMMNTTPEHEADNVVERDS
jgi:hypothetical protein